MNHESIPIAPSSIGTHRTVDVYRFGEPRPGVNVYIQAAIHADEQPASLVGAHLVQQLAALETTSALRGQVTVVPVANPIGLDQVNRGHHDGRHDQRSGGNFNRDFPDLSPLIAEQLAGNLDADSIVAEVRRTARMILEDWTTMGELSALRVCLMRLAIDADLVLDLHTGHGSGMVHLFASERDWPAILPLASTLGAECVYWHSPYPRNSTFTASVGAIWAKLAELRSDLAVPQGSQALVVELRGQSDYAPDLARADAARIIDYLRRRGTIDGDTGPSMPAPRYTGAVDCIEIGYSSVAGTLFFHKQAGDEIAAGDIVCSIFDAGRPLDPAFRTSVVARTSGRLLTRSPDGDLAWPNRMIFSVAGTRPVPPLAGAIDMRS